MTVSDNEIIAAQASLSGSTGLFAEPAAAAAFAGFQKAAPGLDPAAVIVILSTGSGLKDSVTATLGINVPEALIDSVDDIL